VCKVLVEEGQTVEAGATIVILEAMKTELIIVTPIAGTVGALYSGPANS